MRARTLFVLLVLSVPAASGADVLEDIGNRITREVAQTFARSYPVIAASAGVTYRFDPLTGTFEREPAMLGQVFIERAAPIGRGRWNVGLSYERVALDTIEGKDVHALRDRIPIALVDEGGTEVLGAATVERLSVRAVTHVATLSVTYGMSDDADVNLTVPVITSDLGSRITARAVNFVTGEFAEATGRDSELSGGIGDVILRGRYRLLRTEPVDVAAGLVLRFPSGDVDQLRGTGTYEIAPLFYASSDAWQPASWARLSAHLNGGVNLVVDDVHSSEGRWGVGLDWSIMEGATLGLAVLGRHPFARLAPAGSFDIVRVLPGPSLGTAPLFGLTGRRPDYYDLSVGGRVSVWRDTAIAFANAVVPLNRDGVRTEIIPLVGAEIAF